MLDIVWLDGFKCANLRKKERQDGVLRLKEQQQVTAAEKEAPIYLLHFIDLLTALQLHFDNAVRNDAIVEIPENSNEPDTSQAIHFVNRRFANTVWQTFPRNLNVKQ